MNRNSFVIKTIAMATIMVYLGCNNPACNPPPPVGGIGTPPAGCSPYPDTCVLDVNLVPQLAPQWCWAASGEMCMEFLNNDGVKICQCDMANKTIRRVGCVNGDASANNCSAGQDDGCDVYLMNVSACCNKPGWPDFGDYNYSALSTISVAPVTGITNTPLSTQKPYLSFQDLATQIFCEQKPVIFTWQWTIQGSVDQAHIMVAYGYAVDNTGAQWVYVRDPSMTYDLVPYSIFVSGNDHTHLVDFYEIGKVK